jgi:stage V sporulation protein SpoVS
MNAHVAAVAVVSSFIAQAGISLHVIPAKAGIHFGLPMAIESKVEMDPGFRRDDGTEAAEVRGC